MWRLQYFTVLINRTGDQGHNHIRHRTQTERLQLPNVCKLTHKSMMRYVHMMYMDMRGYAEESYMPPSSDSLMPATVYVCGDDRYMAMVH